MAGIIPRAFIDDLIARYDIVDVVDARVKLKKAGKNFTACCPFHNEKTPSFSVSQDKQFYHCFGCGAHGNILDFVMEFDRLEFVDAIEELAGQLGLEVPREGGFRDDTNHKNKRSWYDTLSNIAQCYQQQLVAPSGKTAIDYLKDRGLSGEIVKKFGIGYVPDQWDLILKRFGQSSDDKQDLITLGMALENQEKKRVYDRFRGRIMFPILNRKGQTIGFGGRILGDGTPKYLNSPETPVFHKGRELYGLYQVMKTHRDPQRILIVEGYMDVVALAQFGVDYAVASLGTATTGDHMHTLYRQTQTLICCYDGDRAGREAAWRAMEQALPHLTDGRQLKFVFLPDGEDPDTYIRTHGKEGFEVQLDNAQDLSTFFFRNLMDRIDTTNKAGIAQLRPLAMPYIEKVAGETLQQYLLGELAFHLGLPPEQLTINVSAKQKPSANLIAKEKAIERNPMRLTVALLLQNPNFAKDLGFDSSVFQNIELPGLNLLGAIIDKCQSQPHISTGQLLEHWRDHKNEPIIARLASWDISFTNNDENPYTVFNDSIGHVMDQCLYQQIEKLQARANLPDFSQDEKQELQQLLLMDSLKNQHAQ